MNLAITYGILDNDPRGESGRGTIHYVKVSVDGIWKEYVMWGLLEELNGTFNPESVTKKYTDLRDAELAAAAAREKQEKEEAKAARLEAVQVDDVLDKLIDEVIASEEKAVAEFKAGKDKALNALVGKVIGQIRKNQLSVQTDAFGITATLKKKLVTPSETVTDS